MKTSDKNREWRVLRHPLRMLLRGWRAGRGCVVSPRGTVFVTRRLPGEVAARRKFEFELE